MARNPYAASPFPECPQKILTMSTSQKEKNAAFMRVPGFSLGVQVSLPLLSDAPEMLINTAFLGFSFCRKTDLSLKLSLTHILIIRLISFCLSRSDIRSRLGHRGLSHLPEHCGKYPPFFPRLAYTSVRPQKYP